ncbi:MAG: CDC27 family protein [Bdellovibrionota bacterium]|nr:CDC27 family protein [Bdellovibrionota bacterium]
MFILGNGPILLSAEKDQAKTNSAKVETNTELKTQKKAVEKDKAKASSKKAKLVRVDKEKLAKRAKLIRKKNIAILKKKIAKKPSKDLKQKLALYLMKDSQYKEAIEIYRELLDPNDLQSYLNLAEGYRANKAWLDEIRVLNQVIPKWPNYANLYFLQANAFKEIDKLDDATIKYRKSLSLQPKFEDAYWGLYEIFKLKKNNYEGRIILQDMIRIFGEKAEYYTELCQNYTEDSYFEEALAACQVAVRLSPKTPKNHVYLGLTQQYKGNNVQAERILNNAARQFPESAFAQESAGKVMQEKENYEVAAKFFRQCIRTDRSKVNCWKGYAQTNFQLGKYKEALKAYKIVCEKDRTILTEFKKQAAILRINGKSNWYDQYTEAVTSCYY